MLTPLQTKAQIAALPVPDEGQVLYWDTGKGAQPGFGVRVTANGKKAYVVQARVEGKSRRVVIGPTTMALAEARLRANKTHTRLKSDQVDITAEKREKRAETKAKRVKDAAQAWTLREVMEQYLIERRVNDRPLKPSTQRDIRRHVEKNFGDWADAPVAGVTVEAVKARFAMMQARAPQQAKQAMGVLRSLLYFARDERAVGDTYPLLAVNPVQIGLKRKLKPADGRERMVPLDKVRATWRMLAERRERTIADSPERTGLDIVSFGLLTGCRLGEAQNLTFDLVNLGEGWWRITAEVAKDRKARTLPLCSAAVALLRTRAARPGNAFVFPSRTIAGREHFKAPRGALDHVSKIAGMHLSYHDLRRTYMAVAAECRVEEWRYELLTSHKPRSVTGRHYRQKYDVRHLSEDAETVGTWITAELSKSKA
ncbi:hypothetical protein BURC_02978 [Burkholderiaceae bacterium]|nr:hypothetical protein BURC_02978 [Burkholderiaceae bacterium]